MSTFEIKLLILGTTMLGAGMMWPGSILGRVCQ